MKNHPRLDFLDGIRGVCATYITIYHAQLYAGHYISRGDLASFLKPLHFFFSFGSFAVPIFLVLSGFCLTIPATINNKKKPSRNFPDYITRRAKRILPPYYIALASFLVLIMLVPTLQVPQNTNWDTKLPVDLPTILSHLFLVHNFSEEWLYKINGPMWSIAIEWQLYFLFPVLLFFWRKFGLLVTTIASIIVGVSLSKYFSTAHVMHVWFLGVFVLGMLAAAITFSDDQLWTAIRNRVRWNVYTPLVAGLTLAVLVISKFTEIERMLLDLVVGYGTCSILIHYALIEINEERRPLILVLLNTKVLRILGGASYSIYLIHSPIQGLINLLTLDINMNPTIRMLFMILVAVPISLAISFGFYFFVERRFILRPTTKKKILVAN